MKPARVDAKDSNNDVRVMSTNTNYTNMTEVIQHRKRSCGGRLRLTFERIDNKKSEL